MFAKNINISEVATFRVSEDFYAFHSKNFKKIVLMYRNIVVYEFAIKSFGGFDIINKSLVYYIEPSSIGLYSILSKRTIILEQVTIGATTLNYNSLITVGEFEGDSYFSSIMDLNTSKITFQKSREDWCNPRYLNSQYIVFSKENTSLLTYNHQSGEFIWHYDLSTFGTYIDWRGDERPHEVKAFLGVWQNELIVAVSNARLLAIDIETGVLRHEWHKLAGFDSGENEKDLMPPAENFILDAQHNCLMGVFNHYYLEINLLDRSIEAVDLAQEFTRCNILIFKKPANNPFTDTHLFLVCMKHYPPNYTQWSYDCLVALNRQTHQIDWEYAFEEANLGTNIPQYAGDRLYQLDTGGTLHIFEREEGRNFTPLASTATSIPN